MPGQEHKSSPSPRTQPEKRRAVVVDSDPDHCALLLLALSQRGYTVVIAHDLREALGVAMRTNVRLAIVKREDECGRAGALFKSVSPATLVVETAENIAPCAPLGPETWTVLPRPLTYDRLAQLLDEAETASVAVGTNESPGLSPKTAAAEPPLTAISSRPHEFS